ncbi:MAG: hypothetical protein AB1806_19180 [Acidobacteriota bacterium]
MAIRKSAAGAIHQLITQLADPDPAVREAASARLSVIGERAVSHLLDAFRHSPSAVARAQMLRVIESAHDRRGLALARSLLASPAEEPLVASAAIRLLGTFVDDEGTEALDTLGALVLDTSRSEAERLAAWKAIASMPRRTLAPIRRQLRNDTNPRVRAAVQQGAEAPELLPSLQSLVEAALSDEPIDPGALAAALRRAPAEAAIPVLHQLVEAIGARERRAVEADRAEWTEARATVHRTLAGRGSRVALYDVRDTIGSATGPLPQGFIEAVSLVGDAACLESIVEALARVPLRLSRPEQDWRDRLIDGGRAVVARARLTRRHAVVRRLAQRHPEIVRVLLASRTDRRSERGRS